MVEAAGMLDDTGYAERMALNRAVVAASDIPLLIITPEMVLSLDRVSPDGCPRRIRCQWGMHPRAAD